MPSNKRKNDSSRAEAPQAKRGKTTNLIDLTEENKENLPANGTNKSEYPALSPPQDIPPWSATAQNYNQETTPSDPDFQRQIKAAEDEKVDRIRATMTAGTDKVFVVEAEQDDEYEGRVGGCIAIHKTLDGALGSALKYLEDYGMTEAVIGEIDDDNDDESEEEVEDSDEDDEEDFDKGYAVHKKRDDFSEEWKRINALLDVAELSGEGEKATLRIMEEDDESTTFTITIEMMKVGT